MGGEGSSGQLIFACDVVMEIAAGFGKEQSSRAGVLLNRSARGLLTAHEPNSEGSGWDIEEILSVGVFLVMRAVLAVSDERWAPCGPRAKRVCPTLPRGTAWNCRPWLFLLDY